MVLDGAPCAGIGVAWRTAGQLGAVDKGAHHFVLHLHVCTSVATELLSIDICEPPIRALRMRVCVLLQVDLLAIVVLKLIFKRARPPHHQTDGRFVGPDQHSFPSGHATRVGSIVGLLFYLSESTSAILSFYRW